jgi:hypothetical protein
MTYEERSIFVKQTGDRNTTRKLAIDAFSEEMPGTGTGKLASRYRYNVENLKNGQRVYLTRPAWLAKEGFDFVIHLESVTFKNGRDNPSHQDIYDDLVEKARENPKAYYRLHEALCRVYACEDPEDILPEYQGLAFKSGLSVEAVLKIVKWFFVEQDLRYWNFSGRGMFKDRVVDAVAASFL